MNPSKNLELKTLETPLVNPILHIEAQGLKTVQSIQVIISIYLKLTCCY